MTIRARRRQQSGENFDELTDIQLAEIYHFGNLVADPRSVTFVATPEQQLRAGELLKERRNQRREDRSR